MIQNGQLAEWVARLVRIPSVSPDHGGAGEEQIVAEIVRVFRTLGAVVTVDPVFPGRSNVYGFWPGQTQRIAAIDVHVDTVGIDQMRGDPFSGALVDERVYGRGAVDTKASLGVALALLEHMTAMGVTPVPGLLLAATVDEEVGPAGASAFARWIRAQGLQIAELLVAEPTMCQPVCGHKGVARAHYTVHGEAAHSSQPAQGKNAITAAAHIITAFEREHARLISGSATPLGHPTLTVSLVNGGRAINVVPDSCTVAIDRRVVANERATDVLAALELLARSQCPLPLTSTIELASDAFLQDGGVPWVAQLERWSGSVATVAPYGSNAPEYAGVVDACVVLGPGSIDQAHGAEEWVAFSELERLASIYSQWWGIA